MFGRDKALGADNQQGSRPAESGVDPSETTRRTPEASSREEILAYLQGAMHDASLNKGNRIRFVQKYREWLMILQGLLSTIKAHSWIYKEGKTRNLYVLETVCKDLSFNFDPRTCQSARQKISYIKGFFDAEGGIPRNGKRFYVQLSQKDYSKVELLKKFLVDLGIESGKIHNPSKQVDPDYWRIFIATNSHKKFADIINSDHPIKKKIFRQRMMI
ncbi:MAG TPA: LAGLIDADG family homing endonuclease [Candidatus Paceibacterota bacterium]